MTMIRYGSTESPAIPAPAVDTSYYGSPIRALRARLLAALADGEERSTGWLAGVTEARPGQVRNALNVLYTKGLIHRHGHILDARKRLWSRPVEPGEHGIAI